MAEHKLMVPVESFAVAQKKGPPRMYRVGKPVLSSDPAVKKYPDKFRDLEGRVTQVGVTAFTATAEPGVPVEAPSDE